MLISRETLPASCYDTCNNAYLEAQRTGKIPALCESGSPFRAYVEACNSCSAEDVDTSSNITDTWLPLLEPYLDYCEAQGSFTLSPITSPSVGSINFVVVSTEIPFTTTIGSVPTTWTFPTVVTRNVSSPIPATAIITVTTALEGELQTLTFTTAYAQLPSDFTAQITNAVTSESAIPRPTSTEFVQSQNRAWVAGPVVGGLAGLLIAGIGSLFLWRRKRKRLTESELHGDSAIKSEMDVPNHPRELEANNPLVDHHEPQELPADGNDQLRTNVPGHLSKAAHAC
ncbi:hypothetical protein F4820DRAFT_424894 [Hypoxylon rubiginosum]|uniref:Uncharacterized protein n=1 Tax=Hypoxylon rubiginosum TaxID=110542 RepID=A0ACB9YXI2_9PEZI|nr:hypothetical protein F4820DRAFT_424894 [Hypoxylon rubiginosum]